MPNLPTVEARKAANEKYFADRNRSIMEAGQQSYDEKGGVTTLRTATIGGENGEPAYIVPTYDPAQRKVLTDPNEIRKMSEADIQSGKLQPYDTWQDAEADLKDFYPRVIRSHLPEGDTTTPLGIDTLHAQKSVRREEDDAVAWAASLRQQREQQAAQEAQAKGQPAEGGQRTLSDLITGKGPSQSAGVDYNALARPKTPSVPGEPDYNALSGNTPGDGGISWRGVIRNLSPLEAMGGALDYADNAFETIRQISAKGDEFLMAHGVPALTSEGLTTDYAKFKDTKNVGDYLPDIGDPEKPGLARSIGKFMAGYAVAGRLLSGVQSIQTLAQSGRVGASAVAALKGAISDFSGLREMEGNLANLIQEAPVLQNPITDFLSAKDESPEVVNKLKTALVGAGVGMATNAVFDGLRAIRAGRQVEAVAGQVDELASGMVREADTQKQMLSATLGPIDDPRLLIPAEVGTGAEQASAAGATGAADEAARAATDGATNPRPNAGGRIGDVYVNWSKVDTPDDVKTVMDDLASRYSDSIAEGQRGTRSWEQTELSAQQEDAWKILTERQKGQPLNAEQTFAVRQLWSSSGTKVAELARNVEAGGGVADRLALQKMIGIHASITEQVLGARTETARALNQWKMLAGESDQFLTGFQSLMSDMETNGNIVDIAKSINKLSDRGRTDAVDAFVQGASILPQLKKYGVNTSDAIRQLFYMSLLSGPKTTVRNSVSNLAMLAANVLDRRGAAYLGEILGGQNVPDQEAVELLYGQVNGLMDAFRISDATRQLAEAEGTTAHSPFVQAVMTGENATSAGSFEAPKLGALSAEKMGLDPSSAMGRVMDYIDTATRMPTHFLAAQDVVFRSASEQGQIHALSYRQAYEEAQSGLIESSQIGERSAELTRDPSTGMRLLAQKYAADTVFQNQPPDSSKLFKAMKAVSNVPVLGKLAMPFTRTPYNIAIEFATRSPLAPLTDKFRTEIAAGGARADIAWTKFLTGNAALIALADLAVKGGLTGTQRGVGGSDARPGLMENKRQMGNVPMSLKFTGSDGTVHTVGFRGMEPFSTHLGMAANVVDILSSDQYDADDKDMESVVIAASAALMNQVTSPSFMQGLSELMTFSDDPSRYGQNYAQGLAAMAIPNAVGEVARSADPTIRDVNGVLDSIKAKTPGLSKDLPAVTDRWGTDLTRASGISSVYDAISPFGYKAVKPSPIDKELDRLDYGLAKPNKKMFFSGVPVNMKLHPHEFHRYMQLQGNELTETVDGRPISVRSIGYQSEGGGLKDELNSIINGTHSYSPIYWDPDETDGPDGTRADKIHAIVSAFREAAKAQLLVESPALRAKIDLRDQDRKERGIGSKQPNKLLQLTE